jgi:hypothetical protein
MLHQRLEHWTLSAAAALLALALGAGCAESSAGRTASGDGPATARGGTPGARDANLTGARCSGGRCTCRQRNGDVDESKPPDADHKRFEIRLGALGGSATLESPTLGHFTAGSDETCFYVDVLPGTTSEATFTARADSPEGGVAPELQIAEYGPKGPWWYDILRVDCATGPGGRCNRDAAEAWGAEAKGRKRGRIEPCGSAVISHLRWDTSGGTGDRELGLFHDFTVQFTIDVKRFATQFHPGATECVPK